MSALTTKLQLYKPGGGLSGLITPDEIVDVDRVNSNMDIIDANTGFRVVTSGTRPLSPYDGLPIYETDTKRVAVWNNSAGAWQYPGAERGSGTDYVIADPDSLAGLTDRLAGDTVAILSGDAWTFVRNAANSTWVQNSIPGFANKAAIDTEYAKAAGALKRQDVLALAVDTGITWRYDTTAAAWKEWKKSTTTFVPAYQAGFTVGNAVVTAKYRISDGHVKGVVMVVCGSTTTWTAGSLNITSPYGTIDTGGNTTDSIEQIGTASFFYQAGSIRYQGYLLAITSGTQMQPRAPQGGGSVGVANGSIGWNGSATAGSNIPKNGVVASGDIIYLTFDYPLV